MSKEAVINLALAERGEKESPFGSNRVKYWEDFGPEWQGQPWCVAFLEWVFRRAGESQAFFGGAMTASCGTLLTWYKAQGQTVSPECIEPGDIVILNFSGKKGRDGKPDTEHCGIVTDKINDAGWWHVVEGNTTPGLEGSQDNGGNVAYKARHIRNVIGVCHPNYKEEKPVAKNDYENHWAKNDIEWAKTIGILKGYEDGTFRPNNSVTRAELAAILRRYDDFRFGGSIKHAGE